MSRQLVPQAAAINGAPPMSSYIYDAFLSYSSKTDYERARKIEAFLESFHKSAGSSSVPVRQLQICRDGSDFNLPRRSNHEPLTPTIGVGADEDPLWLIILDELSKAQYLIVLCSPGTVKSSWVSKEIRWFMANRSQEEIILAVTEGTDPKEKPEECFPPDIIISKLNESLIWYDLRGMEPAGRRAGTKDYEDEMVRLSSDLLGWDADTHGSLSAIWQREQSKRRRRQSVLMLMAAALFLVLGGYALVSARQKEQALQDLKKEVERNLKLQVENKEVLDQRDREVAEKERIANERNKVLNERDEAQNARDRALAGEKVQAEKAIKAALIAEERRKEAEKQTDIAKEQRREAVKQRDQALRAQSLFLADLSNQKTSAGETRQGILLALEALPDDPQVPDRPLVIQAEAALYRALTASREVTTFEGHQDKVLHATFAPGGRIVTSSLDRTVKLWDNKTGKNISTFRVEADLSEAIRHVTFSSDGARFLTSSFRYARLWDTDSGNQLNYLSGDREYDDRIFQSEFSEAGAAIITLCAGKIRLWDSSSGLELPLAANIQTGGTPIAIDRKLTRVLTKSKDGKARLWDAKKGSELAVVGNADYTVAEATFSPDAKRLATYNSSQGGKLRLWDADTGAEVAILEGHDGVVSAYFSPTSNRLVTHGWDPKFSSGLAYHSLPRLWTRDGAPIKSLQGHEGPIRHVAFSSDGELFATASADGTVRVWKSWDGTEVNVLRGHLGEVLHVEFSPDRSHILTTSTDKTARLWAIGDANLMAKLPATEGRYNYADLNLEASRLITSYQDGTIVLWDTNTWTVVSTMREHKSSILRAAWLSDNTRFVTAAADGSVRLWDAGTGTRLSAFEGHKGFIRGINLDSEGRRLITAGDDGTARVWNLDTGSAIAVLNHEEPVGDAFLLGDGKHVATISFGFIHSKKTVKLWDISKGAIVDKFQGPVCWTKVGTTGKTLMVSSSGDNILRVWNLDQRNELSKLEGKLQDQDANITASAFSQDGKYLALGSVNGIVRVWEVASGAKVSELRGHLSAEFDGQIQHISFSPDGKHLVTGSVDRTARLWEIKSGIQVAVSPDHEDSVTDADFGPGGKHLVTMGGGVRLWDAETGATIFSIPKEKLGFIFSPSLVDEGRILMITDDTEISIFNMFPSHQANTFPTTSTLVEFAKKIPLAPLTDDERKRFFLPVTKDH